MAIDNQIGRLNVLRTNDPPLPFPHSSQISGELRELRCHYGRRLFRVLYRRFGEPLYPVARLREEFRPGLGRGQGGCQATLAGLPGTNGRAAQAPSPGGGPRRAMSLDGWLSKSVTWM